jgi:hypothetical protein
MQEGITKRFFKKLYPDQALCFWLGFLPTGIWVALLATGVEAGLNTLCKFDHSSLVETFVLTMFLYGAAAGLTSIVIGYFIRNIRPNWKHRWVALAFVVPIFAFMLAGIEVEIINMIQCPSTGSEGHSLQDAFMAILMYGVAAIVSGVLAIATIGACKLVSKTAQLTRVH